MNKGWLSVAGAPTGARGLGMRVLVWLGWVLVTIAAAGAADQVIPVPLRTDDDARVDVYIDDSLEAHDKIERARRLARRERWSEAAALLEDASAAAGFISTKFINLVKC